MGTRQLGPPPIDDYDLLRKTDVTGILYRVESTETFAVASGRGLMLWNESIMNGRLVVNGVVRAT